MDKGAAMPDMQIRTATASEQENVLAALVTAFSADPVMRWVYPEAGAYLQHFPGLVIAYAGRAFDHDSAYFLGGAEGAALWLPPGVAPDEESLGAHLERTVPAARKEALFSMLEQIEAHHPQTPHWYLPFIGIDPRHHRRGLGSALLRHVTAVCDRDGVPAYLESSNPANIPLYERHGFRVLGEARMDEAPPIFPMLRDPE